MTAAEWAPIITAGISLLTAVLAVVHARQAVNIAKTARASTSQQRIEGRSRGPAEG